ncbi:MAG: 50S ribosomal protein L24 [Sandaracinaceae bacterium]|nr:50S ribosomal protein L24 [Sandaracinaceae bacterium]
MSLHIKKNDLVIVVSGKSKGTQGRVLKVIRETGKVIVEGVNRIKRHTKPTPRNREGGIIEKEAALPASKVMLLDTKTNKPTRTKVGQDKEGKKIRVAVKSGTVLDG